MVNFCLALDKFELSNCLVFHIVFENKRITVSFFELELLRSILNSGSSYIQSLTMPLPWQSIDLSARRILLDFLCCLRFLMFFSCSESVEEGASCSSIWWIIIRLFLVFFSIVGNSSLPKNCFYLFWNLEKYPSAPSLV